MDKGNREMTALSPISTKACQQEPLSGLRVVHVVLSMDCGGLERLVLNLACEARERNQEVTVLCLEQPGALAPTVEASGTRLVCIHKRPGLRLTTVARINAALRVLRPDVVHTHQVGALLYAGPAARLQGTPVVVHTEHSKQYCKRWRTRWLGRVAGLYADCFCCVSRDVATHVLRYRIVPRKKVHVVYNGIRAAQFVRPAGEGTLRRSLGITPRAPVVGTIGRIVEVKRHELLVRAFAQVRASLQAAHLLIVGDGPLMASLRQLALRLGIEDIVHLVGYQEEPERFLHIMNVFALPSRSEGIPLVVLEAWATGVPVVASCVGGLPELIDNGVTGLLFSPDDETELAEKVIRVLTRPDIAQRLCREGKSRLASRHTIGHMADQYESYYRLLLAQT